MSPLDVSQREGILRRLEFMRTEAADLGQFREMTREIYDSTATAGETWNAWRRISSMPRWTSPR